MNVAAALVGLGVVIASTALGCASSTADDDGSSSAADSANSATCGIDPTSPTAARRLLNAPITDPTDAATRIGCFSTIMHAQHDGRAPFATLYLSITNSIDAAIKGGTTFEDGAWTATYLTSFAEAYRETNVAYMDGQRDQVPGAWLVMLDAAKESKTLLVQDLALAVNAHVNHDLSHALYTVGIGTGDTRASHQRDHFAVNGILHAAVQSSLQTFATMYAPGFDEIPSTIMDFLTATYFASLEAGRLKAWYDAVGLTDTTSLVHDGVEDEIDATSKALGDAILIPSIDPALAAKLHQLELGKN